MHNVLHGKTYSLANVERWRRRRASDLVVSCDGCRLCGSWEDAMWLKRTTRMMLMETNLSNWLLLLMIWTDIVDTLLAGGVVVAPVLMVADFCMFI